MTTKTPREQAIQKLMSDTGVTHAVATGELDRYLTIASLVLVSGRTVGSVAAEYGLSTEYAATVVYTYRHLLPAKADKPDTPAQAGKPDTPAKADKPDSETPLPHGKQHDDAGD